MSKTVVEEGGKLKRKTEYLKNQRRNLGEIKPIFHSFLRVSSGDVKKVGHKL